jgi:hypothetical protein
VVKIGRKTGMSTIREDEMDELREYYLSELDKKDAEIKLLREALERALLERVPG